jgi:hypothetical protein
MATRTRQQNTTEEPGTGPSAKAMAEARKKFDGIVKGNAGAAANTRGNEMLDYLAGSADETAAPSVPYELPEALGEDEHPTEVPNEEGTVEVEGTETDAEGESPLDEQARSYLKLKVPGLTDAAIDALDDPAETYRKVLERETNVDRTFRERAELQRQLDEGKVASTESELHAVPADSLDLSPPADLMEALGYEADGDEAKLLKGWLEKAVGPIAQQNAQFARSVAQSAEQAIEAHRARLSVDAPHLSSSEGAWDAVRGRATELADQLQQAGKRVDGTALFNQAFEEIMGRPVSGAGKKVEVARKPAQKSAAKAASAPTSGTRKTSEGGQMDSAEINRRVFEHLQKHPGDTVGARNLSQRLREEAGLTRR